MLVGFTSFAQKITRGPYLQKPTPTSMTIHWRTDESTVGKVTYQKKGSSQLLSVEESSANKDHILELQGLEPNTVYQYTIETTTKVLSEVSSNYFKTFPVKDSQKPIRIWAMGDFGDFTKKSYIDNQNAAYKSFLKHNNNQDLDLWMWLGDNAYCCGRDEEYQRGVFEYFDPKIFAKTPIVSVPGNHEYYFAAGSENTRKIPYYDIISTHTKGEAGGVPSGSEAFYSFDIGDIHFVSLDSYGLDNGKKLYNRESPQYQWLLQDLEENQDKMWTIVFLHHPPYTKRSHDSDTENDLVELRRVLVPVFDKFKVDLVLSGHSHTYERSYLIKNQIGYASDFKYDTDVVQKTKAFYTKDSAPIINKNEGTMYAVVGSAGRLDWNGKKDPHTTSVYSNVETGGSLLLTIDHNRLDGKWMCGDGEIRDNFTVFKQVNKVDTVKAFYGQDVSLTASWPGTYKWSSDNSNQRSIKVNAQADMEISVSDSLGFLKDIFYIKTGPRPVLTPILKTTNQICSGTNVTGTIDVKNEKETGWNYKVLLSNKAGNFDDSVVLGTTSNSSFSFLVPEKIDDGQSYKIKIVVPENPYFQSVESSAFSIYNGIKVVLSPEGTVPFNAEIQLSLELEGSLPATVKITNLEELNVTESPFTLKVSPATATIYKIEHVKNTCGLGEVLGEGLIVQAPLGKELSDGMFVRVYPNPGQSKFVVESKASKDSPIKLVIYDMLGRKVLTKRLINSQEVIELNQESSGKYVFNFRQGRKETSLNIIKN